MIDISATIPGPVCELSLTRRSSSTKTMTNIKQKIVRKIPRIVRRNRQAK